MIKKFGIIIFIYALLCWGIRAQAQTQFSPTLTKMEKSLFGVDYNSQNDEARLKRIEDVVYGQNSNGTTQQRVSKLSKDLSADLIGQEIKPKKDTFEDEEQPYKEKAPVADKNINYPVVDSLEQTVFNKQFKTTEINQRLANLEQNVFKKAYSADDLSSRVDRLKLAVAPQQMARNNDNEDGSDDSSYIPNMTGGAPSIDEYDGYSGANPPLAPGYNAGKQNYFTPNYNSKNSVLDGYEGDSDIVIPLATLEKSILKKSFPDDEVSNRLTRLEAQVFNSSFTDDDAQTRLDRIASARQAQRTSKKYDSNKVSQRMTTAVQVGAMLLMLLAAIL